MSTHKTKINPYDSPEVFERRNRIRTAKKSRRQLVYAACVLFLAFYFAFCLVITLYYYLSFNSTPDEAELYSISILNERGKTVARTSAEGANKRFGFYISLGQLDKLCDLSVAGDEGKLTIILRESGENLECFTNSSFLYINGNPARLSIPVLYENYEYYLPVELIEQYFMGVNIVYEKGICKMSLADKEAALELKLKSQPLCPPIAEP